MPHREIEPASAGCRSDALPTELQPHPSGDLPSVAFVFQVGMKTILNCSSASRLSPTLPSDSGMPSLGRRENMSLLQLFARSLRLTCLQTSDLHHHPSLRFCLSFLSVFIVVYRCLPSGKEPAPLCTRAWLFYGCLGARQIDIHHRYHHHHHYHYHHYREDLKIKYLFTGNGLNRAHG